MGVPNMSYPELRMDLGVSPDGHFALFSRAFAHSELIGRCGTGGAARRRPRRRVEHTRLHCLIARLFDCSIATRFAVHAW